MKQLDYVSKAMNKDIRPANWVSPRSKDKVNLPVKIELWLRKPLFSTIDVVGAVLFILVVKFLKNHVSVHFH